MKWENKDNEHGQLDRSLLTMVSARFQQLRYSNPFTVNLELQRSDRFAALNTFMSQEYKIGNIKVGQLLQTLLHEFSLTVKTRTSTVKMDSCQSVSAVISILLERGQ